MAISMPLAALLPPTPLQIAPTFLILGIAFHQCIRSSEIDNKLGSLLALYSTTCLALCISYIQIHHSSIHYALGNTLFAATCFSTGLTISIITYRAFFHRLNNFPGPWDVKLSRLFAVKRAINRTQYHLDLQEMHQKYGDFVRTGPREISINRPSAVNAINGSQSPCTKAPWYSHVSDDKTQISLNSTRDPSIHRVRRKAWDRGFSIKGQPLDIAQWTMYFAFDVMGLVGFSADFGQLEKGTEQATIKELHQQMLFLGILKGAPWILTILGSIQGLVGDYGQFMTYCADRVAEKRKQWISRSDRSKENLPQDVISWLVKAIEDNDQSAPPGLQALNEDGRLMIIAGSDTTATTLSHALYYLTRNPKAYKTLQKELLKALDPTANDFPSIKPGSFPNSTLKSLPYLNAVINETLRLKPAIPSGQPRLTPPEGIQIDEVWIPGDTIVNVPQYVMQRDERWFSSADKFRPERWLDGMGELIKGEDQEGFFPFQLGRYSCVGKQLALMQLRGVIARIAYEFDISFAAGEDGVAFDEDSLDTFTFTLGSLRLVFTERERGMEEVEEEE